MTMSAAQFIPLHVGGKTYWAVDSAGACERIQPGSYARLPFSLRLLVENILRCEPDAERAKQAVGAVLARSREIDLPYRPSRVIVQDLLGTPALVDLAALRDAVAARGGDPRKVNPAVPVHLVVDHSLNVDHWAQAEAKERNLTLEQRRNAERFAFFAWCNRAFSNLTVIPSGNGILHQINLERLTPVIATQIVDGANVAFPDTLVGTDSHTPMINAAGVLGWGVGGIEAEAAMLGRPLMMRLTETIGVRLTGRQRPGILATDVVLALTQLFRGAGVVGALLEFFGPGTAELSLPDRATIANMAPEFGATTALFSIDEHTIHYLETTGRSREQCALVRSYAQLQGLGWRALGRALYDRVIEFDLGGVERAMAGPKHPHQRLVFAPAVAEPARAAAVRPAVPAGPELPEGATVIAAITACTNTSNPRSVLAAALLARNAVRRGLRTRPWTKTSFAPGSRVVADYLQRAGLQPALDALGFQVVGFGCTTCCGQSGPLGPVGDQIRRQKITTSAVLSGNRNFEGRIHPLVREAFIMSPPLVVAYAIAGAISIDVQRDPLGFDDQGQAVYLQDIWPEDAEIDAVERQVVTAELFSRSYAAVSAAYSAKPKAAGPPVSPQFDWSASSTYVRRPPYWDELPDLNRMETLCGLRPLAILGDHITTDHLSPSGAILPESDAGQFLLAAGVAEADFNSYGTRRGNHEIGMRSSFASPRLRNEMLAEREGPWTRLMPAGAEMSIFSAAQRYRELRQPLIVVAGREYGSGSSRDWAAKGPALLGVKVVVAESFERIHRANLAGMGVLPLEFMNGDTRKTLLLTADETYDVISPTAAPGPGAELILRIHRPDGTRVEVPVRSRLDTDEELGYFVSGGLLPTLLQEYLS
jgi:aconitate hydratase